MDKIGYLYISSLLEPKLLGLLLENNCSNDLKAVATLKKLKSIN